MHNLFDKKPPKQTHEAPENAWELVKALGCEPTEGVIIALFPKEVTEVALTGEKYAWDEHTDAWGIIGDLGGDWGERLLELATEPKVAVKWWKVREFAQRYGFNLVPDRWNGAIQDIPQQYFEANDEGERPHLGIRFYSEGPWFWPLESPKIELEEDPDDAKIKRAIENLNVLKGFAK